MIRALKFGAALLTVPAAVSGAWAQEVVQPLPPPGSDALNSALRRLASNPRDVAALIDAGEAALKVGDIDAAMGFYGRARDLAPENARIKLGMATAFARSRRSIEALRLFAEAEKLGADRAAMAADRGLAFDMVGDAASAQSNYRLAMTRSADPELTRRLALSQAIAKDKRGFEATLLPLLQRGDLAAFRTRAFGLAILGETDAAVKIAQDMMPREMAARMTPYLRYMPQLTQAQQAAAGNLGIFPSAATLAVATPAQPPASRLEPQGKPLGAGPARASARADPRDADPRRRPDRTATRAARAAPPADVAREGRAAALAAATRAPAPSPASATSSERPPPPASPPRAVAVQTAPRPAPAAAPQSRSVELPPATANAPRVAARQPASGASGSPVVVAQIAAGTAQNASPANLPATPPAPAPREDVSLAAAFSSFVLPSDPEAAARPGAVDITAIRIPREVEEPPAAKPLPPPKPAKPVHPSRHWVQVATGKNVGALAFDWRRIARKAEGKLDGKGPFTAPWVEANRLLAGPYASDKEARDMVKALKALDIDSFTFTSAAGEEIEPLK